MLAVACAHRKAGGGRWNSPCQCGSLRVLAIGDLLLNGRAHVLTRLAMRAHDHLDFTGLASARRRHWLPGTLGSHVGGRIFDALLLSLSMAKHRRVSGHLSWEIWATPLIWMHFPDRISDPALVFNLTAVAQ